MTQNQGAGAKGGRIAERGVPFSRLGVINELCELLQSGLGAKPASATYAFWCILNAPFCTYMPML